MHEDDAHVFAALRAGARGYLVKGADGDEIIRAVLAVAGGDAVYGGSVARRIVDFFAGGNDVAEQRAFPAPDAEGAGRARAAGRRLPQPELATRFVHSLGTFEMAQVARAPDHDECRVRDRLLELARDEEGRAHVVLPPDQQGGDGDVRQQVAQVSLGHDGQLAPEGGRAHVGGDVGEQRHELRRRVVSEESGKRGVELRVRDGEHLARAGDARSYLICWQ